MQLTSIAETTKVDVTRLRRALSRVGRVRAAILAARSVGILAIVSGVALAVPVLADQGAALPAWVADLLPNQLSTNRSMTLLIRAVGPMVLMVAGVALQAFARVAKTTSELDARSEAEHAAVKMLRQNAHAPIETIDAIRFGEYGSHYTEERGITIVAQYRRDGAAIEGQMDIVDGGGLRYVERERR